MYYLYILECKNGAYYIGYTTDLLRRYREHAAGSAKCKYTRAFPPQSLAASWYLDLDLSMILRLEAALKKLTRSEKNRLVAEPHLLLEVLACDVE